MRLCLALIVVATSCFPALVEAQTNPLWSEQKVKNFLPHMTWPEVRDLLARSDMVLIPIPALEQHGPHGPIGTDYYSGVEQSKLIAQRTDILVAPILFVGQSPYVLYSRKHCAIGGDSAACVLRSSAESDQSGIPPILLYASHAGNQYIASYVADRLNQETSAVAVNLADGVTAMREPPDGRQLTSNQPVPFDRHGGVRETSGRCTYSRRWCRWTRPSEPR